MVNASALPMIGAACCNSGMLTGPELGAALERAMRAMDVTQSAVAQEFGIKQPSVSEWIKYGRIGKRHLTHLVARYAPSSRAPHTVHPHPSPTASSRIGAR